MIGVERAALAAIARRPDLWPTAVGLGLRLAPRGWWRRWPPRPWPDPAYLRFRLETMYGTGPGPTATIAPADLVAYMEWCRRGPGRSR